jgi:hypothetical protein
MVIARRNGFPSAKRSPSAALVHTAAPVDRSGAGSSSLIRPTRVAETRNETTSTRIASGAVTAWTSAPAALGPTAPATERPMVTPQGLSISNLFVLELVISSHGAVRLDQARTPDQARHVGAVRSEGRDEQRPTPEPVHPHPRSRHNHQTKLNHYPCALRLYVIRTSAAAVS